ncbi:MAG: hypothetical protein CFE26_14125, partial [Verrucomicrobiales bacterium VVV1]
MSIGWFRPWFRWFPIFRKNEFKRSHPAFRGDPRLQRRGEFADVVLATLSGARCAGSTLRGHLHQR